MKFKNGTGPVTPAASGVATWERKQHSKSGDTVSLCTEVACATFLFVAVPHYGSLLPFEVEEAERSGTSGIYDDGVIERLGVGLDLSCIAERELTIDELAAIVNYPSVTRRGRATVVRKAVPDSHWDLSL